MGDPKAAIEFIADYLITIRRDMVSLALVERLQRESGFDLNLAHGDKREKWATKEDLIAKDPYASIDALRDRVQELEAENAALSVNCCNGPCEIDTFVGVCVWAINNASNYFKSCPDGGSYFAVKSFKIEMLKRAGRLPKGPMSTDEEIDAAEATLKTVTT